MTGRILVVEDEKIIQLDLRYQLEHLGYVVAGMASTGEEAVTKATELAPDLILMDVRLKGRMDGIEAAKQIRAMREVPVIYLTAQDNAALNKLGEEALNACVPKPFRTGDLERALAQALEWENTGPRGR